MKSLKVLRQLAFLLFLLASVGNLVSKFIDWHFLTVCTKPLIVPSLALFCWSILKGQGISGFRVTTLLCALAFGAIGDILLMLDGNAAFSAGLASFLIGHIFYLVTIGVPSKERSGSHFAIGVLVPSVLIFIMAMTAQLFNIK